MDFLGGLSEMSEASEIKGVEGCEISKEANDKFDKLMGDDNLKRGIPEQQDRPKLDYEEINEKFNKLFDCGDFYKKEREEELKPPLEDVNNNSYDSNNATIEKERTEDKDEVKILSRYEIDEKQKSAIKEALGRIRNDEKLTNEELGNLGEMMMDQYYISKGYEPLNTHRVTSLDDKKNGFKTGIDGVYEKNNPDGTKSYVIADAKYNTSQLSETNDGKQMSDNWIDKRLDDAVGKEKADEIRDATEDNPDFVSHEIYHISSNIDENDNSHTDIQKVDSNGNKVGDKTIVEYFDKNGNRIELLGNN